MRESFPPCAPEPLRRRCEIRVPGPIGPTILQAFPALTAHRDGADTLLDGWLPDQAAVWGVLHQLESLGLELLEVRSSPPARVR